MTRERLESDDEELRALHGGNVPKLDYEWVLVEDGRVVGHAGFRMVPEAVLVLANDHPATRMYWLREFQAVLLNFIHETGYRRIFALIAPEIERGFLRRLKSLGWQEGFKSAIFLAEDEHVGNNRSDAERASESDRRPRVIGGRSR